MYVYIQMVCHDKNLQKMALSPVARSQLEVSGLRILDRPSNYTPPNQHGSGEEPLIKLLSSIWGPR